jgi:mono/diheme cytochrome c family protein
MAMRNIIVLVAGLTFTAAPAFAQQAPMGNVLRGKALYEQVGCYACHGLAGQGAPATGPRVSRTPYPFASFLLLLRQPQKQMPPYAAAVLPDQDAADIYAYVRQMPTPRAAQAIPLLRAGQ